jgi:hypothetical protein
MFATVATANVTLFELAVERRALDACEAAWLQHLAEYDACEQWRDDGHACAADALMIECRMTEGAARGHVELAHKLQVLPQVAAAFATGDVSRQHVQVIAKAHTPARADAFPQVEATLLSVAQTQDPSRLSQIVQQIGERLDGDDGRSADEQRYERRRWSNRKTLDGMGSGHYAADPESNEVILTALKAEMERDRRKDESRTSEQRRFDAAVNIFRRALDNGDLGSTRSVRPHISVVAHVAEDGHIEATTAFGQRLSQSTLERIMCDCDISRVIMRGKSEVLDVGRASRTPTVAQWKALAARDGGCRRKGCNRPPAFCEAHHKWYWEDGGPTDIDNLELLCWFHHHEEHKNDHRRRTHAPSWARDAAL